MKTGAIYKKQVYQILSRGKFISQASTDHQIRTYYENIQENEEAYRSYFAEEGLILDHGRGYYQFCHDTEMDNVASAILVIKRYITIFSILIAWRDSIGPGDTFQKKELFDAASTGDEDFLRELTSYAKRDSYRDIINDLIATLRADGIIEKFMENDTEKFYVTSAYNYLEDLYDNTKVYNEEP